MKLNLFLLCLTGIVPITLSTVTHTYKLIMTPMTWSAAQNYCRGTYGDLAAVESSDDKSKITAEAVKYSMTTPGWIGLYNNVDSWRWSLNNVLLKDTALKNWASSEPSNDGACGAIDNTGYWSAKRCIALNTFVCYDSTRVNDYILYASLQDWFGAQAYCRTFHTDLASATTQAENNKFINTIYSVSSAWFGLFRDPWTWTDGTIGTNLSWSVFNPNYAVGDCATFKGGMFFSGSCSNPYPFYCHSVLPVRQVQIIKLQVKSDVSVLDPAVQFSALQQIKQKLDGLGVVNTTVTWRVQPNKKIFYKENKYL
ncbi:putative C-type lectin domain family 20 member A isoform 1-T3 [Clarias gariepinus]